MNDTQPPEPVSSPYPAGPLFARPLMNTQKVPVEP